MADTVMAAAAAGASSIIAGFPPATLPALPEFELRPVPELIEGVRDTYVALALPVISYWVVSIVFHLFDVLDLFPHYRLHTPAEITARNKVSRRDVLYAVLLQQFIQTVMGLTMAQFEPDAVYGREEHDVAVWGRRIRQCQAVIPLLLRLVGVDAVGLAAKMATSRPVLAGILAGGRYPGLDKTMGGFAGWELAAAGAIYWYLIPAAQMFFGTVLLDSWQYFWHRAMHLNRWMYVKFHSHHHRLYVPYAYGALYNHPFEGFLLDTLGTCIAYTLAGMTTRQTMVFFTLCTIKTVDDHCGYALPWDPLQHISSNNAAYHDIHHQSWGIKTNFSQPFFVFWDVFMGTMWKGDSQGRYDRDRAAAEKKVGQRSESVDGVLTESVSALRESGDGIVKDVRKRLSVSAAAMAGKENIPVVRCQSVSLR